MPVKKVFESLKSAHDKAMSSLDSAIASDELSFIRIEHTSEYERKIHVGTDNYLLTYKMNLPNKTAVYETSRIERDSCYFGSFKQTSLPSLLIEFGNYVNSDFVFKQTQDISTKLGFDTTKALTDFGAQYLKVLANYEEKQ